MTDGRLSLVKRNEVGALIQHAYHMPRTIAQPRLVEEARRELPGSLSIITAAGLCAAPENVPLRSIEGLGIVEVVMTAEMMLARNGVGQLFFR